jgi:Holliday junction resolvasome RuvABC DNA-binding subunit
MGAMADYFIEQQESICDDFAADKLTREEATKALVRMGFDSQESRELLDGAIA